MRSKPVKSVLNEQESGYWMTRVLSKRTRNKKQRRREEDKSNRWDQEVFQKLLVSTEVRMERFPDSWEPRKTTKSQCTMNLVQEIY